MLSSGTKCYHLELMLSSGANVIIWDEMLSSRMLCYHLELILSPGTKCYHMWWNAGSQPMSTAVHMKPILWRSNSIFILWVVPMDSPRLCTQSPMFLGTIKRLLVCFKKVENFLCGCATKISEARYDLEVLYIPCADTPPVATAPVTTDDIALTNFLFCFLTPPCSTRQ